MIHNLKPLFIIVCFSLLNVLLPLHAGQMPFTYPSQTPQPSTMSPAELAELEGLEKQLAQAAQEIDQYVASLPAEEQAQFHQAVKEVESMIENMSEEEFNQLIGEMFQEETPSIIPQPEPIPLTPVAEEIKIEVPQLSIDQERKQDTALTLVESLIKYTNSFIVKTQIISEIPGSVSRWATQGKIAGWPATTTWLQFAKQIDLLNQKFHILLDKDAKNNSYRYLLELVNNEKVFMYLSNLQKILLQHEPLIETPSFGVEKMSSKAKDALQKVVAAYNTALHSNMIIKEIDAIISTYDPTAKKLKEEEIRSAERAKGNKPASMGRVVTGGRPDQQRDNNFNSNNYGFGPGSYSNSSLPSTTSASPSTPAESNDKSKEGAQSSPSSSGAKDKGSKPSDDKNAKKDIPGTSDAAADRLMGQLQETFGSIQLFFDEYPLLKNIKAHILTKTESVDPLLSSSGIMGLDKRINNAINQIKNLERQTANLTDKVKDNYKKELASLYATYKDPLVHLEQDLVYIKDNWDVTKNSISADKKYVYFKEGQLSAVPKTAPQTVEEFDTDSLETPIDDITETPKISLADQKAQVKKSFEEKNNVLDILFNADKQRLQRVDIEEENIVLPTQKKEKIRELEKQYKNKKEQLKKKYEAKLAELTNKDEAVEKDTSLPIETKHEESATLKTDKGDDSPVEEDEDIINSQPEVSNLIQSPKSLFELLDSLQKLKTTVTSFSSTPTKKAATPSLSNKVPPVGNRK